MRANMGLRCPIPRSHRRNEPLPSIDGLLAKRKIAQLEENGCFACRSVPPDDERDPYKTGGLTLNYVKHAACSSIPSGRNLRTTIYGAQSSTTSTPSHPSAVRKSSALNSRESGFVELSEERRPKN